jgi:hypothetical protein
MADDGDVDEGASGADGDGQPAAPLPLGYVMPGTVNRGAVGKLVTIATFAQAWEAHLALGKLEAAGIGAVLADENIVGIGGGLYSGLAGGIKLQVPSYEIERAMEALPRRVWVRQYRCPKCGSVETRELDFTVGTKILFLCLLGVPYLFVRKQRFCLNCQTVWLPTPVPAEADDEEEDEGETTDEPKEN